MKALLLGRLSATHVESERPCALESGTICECISSRKDGRYYHLSLLWDGGHYNMVTPMQYVFLYEGENLPPPVFRKIRLRYQLPVVDLSMRRTLLKPPGAEIQVEVLVPNDADHPKEFAMLGRDEAGHRLHINNVHRSYIDVTDGVDEAASVWDDDVVKL